MTRVLRGWLTIGILMVVAGCGSASQSAKQTTLPVSGGGQHGVSVYCAGAWTCLRSAARQLHVVLLAPADTTGTKFGNVSSLPPSSAGDSVLYSYAYGPGLDHYIVVTESSRPQEFVASDTTTSLKLRGVQARFARYPPDQSMLWWTAAGESWSIAFPSTVSERSARRVAESLRPVA